MPTEQLFVMPAHSLVHVAIRVCLHAAIHIEHDPELHVTYRGTPEDGPTHATINVICKRPRTH